MITHRCGHSSNGSAAQARQLCDSCKYGRIARTEQIPLRGDWVYEYLCQHPMERFSAHVKSVTEFRAVNGEKTLRHCEERCAWCRGCGPQKPLKFDGTLPPYNRRRRMEALRVELGCEPDTLPEILFFATTLRSRLFCQPVEYGERKIPRTEEERTAWSTKAPSP